MCGREHLLVTPGHRAALDDRAGPAGGLALPGTAATRPAAPPSPREARTVESAALSNEAYLKLVRAGRIPCESRMHFLAVCSQIMRRILVDHARRRGFAKRGGDALYVGLDEALLKAKSRGVELLALEEALDALERIDHRKSRVVELRYFGGLNVDEIAQVLDVSPGTVKRDWRFARAWLLTQLTGTGQDPR